MTKGSANSGATSKSLRRRKKQRRAAQPVEDTDDVLYTIRDIIDEKKDKRGNLLYLIDWDNDPQTGESYDPSWEPAENATEAAVRDWERAKERKKQQRELSTEASDSQPVRDPNWRAAEKRRRALSQRSQETRPTKRARASREQDVSSTAGESDTSRDDWKLVEEVPRHSKVILELPVRTDFDRSEFAIVPPSQSSQPSQPVEDEGKQTDEAELTRRTVIPDSQGLTDSLPSLVEADEFDLSIPGAVSVQVPDSREVQQPAESPEVELTTQTGAEIPSHQPDHPHQDSPHLSVLQEPGVSNSGDTPSSPSGFLSQQEPDIPLASTSPLRTEGSAVSTSSRRNGKDVDDSSLVISETSSLAPAASHSQAAQVVPPPATQSQLFLSSSGEVVPETAKKSAGTSVKGKSRESRGVVEHAARSNTAISVPANQSSLARTPEKPSSFPSNSRPSTPVSMDGSPVPGTPRSAVEELRQRKAAFLNKQLPMRTSPSPPPEFIHPHVIDQTLAPPAGDDAHPAMDETMGLGLPSTVSASELLIPSHVSATEMGISPSHLVMRQDRPDIDTAQIPATVAPSDLLTSTDHGSAIDQILPLESHHLLAEDLGRSTLEQYPDNDFEDDREKREVLITLPLAANSRDRYLRLISEEKATMIEFGEIFTTTLSGVPEPSLVARLDSVFDRLFDICDVPPYAEDIPRLKSRDKARHATNTNSKFLFTYELLLGLKGLDMRVLILSRPGLTFDYLKALVTTGEWESMVLGSDDPRDQTGDDLMVVLADAQHDLTSVPQNVDVVILFDDLARSASLPPSLGYNDMGPLILSLVATYCVDHLNSEIDTHLGHKLDPLERKNALNSAVATAKKYLRAPDYRSMDGDYPEPHTAAEIFARFLRDPGAGDLAWDPQSLPEDVFDVWASQREAEGDGQRQPVSLDEPNTRKRRSDDPEEGDSKRLRTLGLRPAARQVNMLEMSELFRKTLAALSKSDDTTSEVAEIPVRQLESMAAKIAELEDRLAAQSGGERRLREHAKSLEAQLRSHQRTADVISKKYKEAIGDRGTFEHRAKTGEEKALKAQGVLEASKVESETLRRRVKDLETQLGEARAALEGSAIPDAAKLARVERELGEAQAKVLNLEKKVGNAERDTDYSRKAYQDASNAHSLLSQENQELRERVVILERKANDNIVKINETNARYQDEAEQRQMDELRARLRECQRDLIVARDEVRHLKNGRRETRQASVPRSPRTTGVMSPRPSRAGVGGGTGSRGTSPAPSYDAAGATGMVFLQQPPNSGRWGQHLRE